MSRSSAWVSLLSPGTCNAGNKSNARPLSKALTPGRLEVPAQVRSSR
jgi:hypothetical protein